MINKLLPIKMNHIGLFLLLGLCTTGHSQIQTNVEALLKFASEAEQEWNLMQMRAEHYAAEHNVPLRTILDNGTVIQLFDVVDGLPVYVQTTNLGAARTTRADKNWPGGEMGLDITGAGYDKIGIWDSGRVRTTHQEFNNTGTPRVVQMDGASSFTDHATHVGGTIVAAGVNSNAIGMIYAGELKAYDWNNHWNEIANAAANGMELSNHSWTYSLGWTWNGNSWNWSGNSGVSPVEDYRFGYYTTNSRQMDVIAYNAPNHLIVVASANDRGDGPSNAGQPGIPEKDGGEDGFDCINEFGTAKNTLTVGNIRELVNYVDPSQVIVNNSSTWGPADDGRIKPDLVAKGTDVLSPTATSNTSYGSFTGTSMASPNTAGTLAQLQILYQELNDGQPLRAATLKGLAIHTTDEAGPHPGPDYMFGWGVLNAARAAEVVLDNTGQNVIDELVLNNGEVYEREMEVVGDNPLRVTLSWTDQPGVVLPPALNPRTPHLRNDLDLRLMGPGGTLHYPWKLDPENPADAAINDSKNYVDNVEMILIQNAPAGTYTIVVDHDGPLVGSQQAFSLIITGIDDYTETAQCSGGLNIPDFDPQNAFLNQKIEWQAGKYASSYEIYFGTDGNGTQTPTNILNGEIVTKPFIQMHLQPSTTYYLKVYPRNILGSNTSCDQIWSFTTMSAINNFPYLVDVEDVTVPSLPSFWQAWNYSPNYNLRWESVGFVGHSGNKSIAAYTATGQRRVFNNWLVSPPIQVDASREYLVSFYYRGFLPNTPEQLKMYWGTEADTSNLKNLAFSADGITFQGWLSGSSLIIPEHDGHIFLAWVADNQDGIGVFLDDMMIEDWGLVGVKESLEKQVKILYHDRRIQVHSDFPLKGAEMSVFSASGQIVLQHRLPETTKYETSLILSSGVYIIQLRAEGLNKTAKLFIN
jgi:hypothetical protein